MQSLRQPPSDEKMGGQTTLVLAVARGCVLSIYGARKRAAFLLDYLDLIPADVCFRVTTDIATPEEIHGYE